MKEALLSYVKDSATREKIQKKKLSINNKNNNILRCHGLKPNSTEDDIKDVFCKIFINFLNTKENGSHYSQKEWNNYSELLPHNTHGRASEGRVYRTHLGNLKNPWKNVNNWFEKFSKDSIEWAKKKNIKIPKVYLESFNIFIDNLNKFKLMLDNRDEGLGKSTKPYTELEQYLVNNWYQSHKAKFSTNSGIFERHPETIKIWKDFINSEKYKIKLLSGIEKNKYNLECIKKYYNTNGKLPSSTSNDHRIAFLGRLHIRMKKNLKEHLILNNQDLTNAWKDFLEYVDINLEWNKMFEILQEFISQEKCLPKKEQKYKSKKIGIWCATQRQAHKNKKLIESRIKKLESINIWSWYIKSKEACNGIWNKMFKILQEFVSEKKCLPNQKQEYKNENIGSWCSTQRQAHKNKKLIESRIKKLESIDIWYWNEKDFKWNNMWNLLNEYTIKKPLYYSPSLPKNLQRWAHRQREVCKEKKLTELRKKKLESINGWFWDMDECWDKKYDLLIEYYNNFKKLPDSKTVYKEFPIGYWCTSQKKDKKDKKISNGRIIKLESIDIWCWAKWNWNKNSIK
jgi:hypothetical protein